MKLIFSSIGIGLVSLVAIVGCQKVVIQPARADGPVPMVRPPVLGKIAPPGRNLTPASNCVCTYPQMVDILGGGTEIDIQYAVLDNGSTVRLGGAFTRMRFSVLDLSEAQSIFRSSIQVAYTLNGVSQSQFQDHGTPGCVYMPEPGLLTNLVVGSDIYALNTSFTWQLPPLDKQGRKITLLVANEI